MSSNAKFGCLLYSTDLTALYEDDMLFRRVALSKKHRRASGDNKVHYKKAVKPVDFFLYNEIAFGDQCRVNDDVYEDVGQNNDGFHFDNRFYTFSSFTLIKTKKDSLGTEESIIRSEKDEGVSKIAYGAFNYAQKPPIFLQSIGECLTARTFCYSIAHIFKTTLDTLAYLKKNEAVHLGITHESILVEPSLNRVFMDGVQHIRFMKELMKTPIKTLEYVLKTHLCAPDNKFPIVFAPVEVALLKFVLDNEGLLSVSPNNIRAVIYEYLKGRITLKKLSPAFQVDFANNCEIALIKYVNVPKQEIIKDILKSGHTWGTHAVSVIFLSILMTMNDHVPTLLKTGFYNKWFKLLIINIHPSPLKRKAVDENIAIFAKINRVSAFSEHVNSLKEMNCDLMVQMASQFKKRVS
jgi:hypothetical protein